MLSTSTSSKTSPRRRKTPACLILRPLFLIGLYKAILWLSAGGAHIVKTIPLGPAHASRHLQNGGDAHAAGGADRDQPALAALLCSSLARIATMRAPVAANG